MLFVVYGEALLEHMPFILDLGYAYCFDSGDGRRYPVYQSVLE